MMRGGIRCRTYQVWLADLDWRQGPARWTVEESVGLPGTSDASKKRKWLEAIGGRAMGSA